MADNTDIAQAVSEAGADTSSAQVAQQSAETGADASAAQIAQSVSETGAGASTAIISQDIFELGPGASAADISQLTIELGRGPEVVPPADSPVGTFTVGAGLGLDWYLALQLSDSGIELRDKVIKSVRVTGKVTNARVKIYGYGPKEDINVTDLEKGIGQKASIQLNDTTQVQQTRRYQMNVKNAMVHAPRIEGQWNGVGIPDRVDELVMEVARQGVRR